VVLHNQVPYISSSLFCFSRDLVSKVTIIRSRYESLRFTCKTWQKTVIAKLVTCQYQQIVEVAHPEAKNATSKAVSKFKAMTAKKGKSILLICLLQFQYKKSIEKVEKVETIVIDSAGNIHELKQSPLFWCGACRSLYGFDHIFTDSCNPTSYMHLHETQRAGCFNCLLFKLQPFVSIDVVRHCKEPWENQLFLSSRSLTGALEMCIKVHPFPLHFLSGCWPMAPFQQSKSLNRRVGLIWSHTKASFTHSYPTKLGTIATAKWECATVCYHHPIECQK